MFVQDCTGSQGSYIASATKNIEAICEHIFQSGKLLSREDLRVGLVAFRDHPPQDHTYITKNFGFSSDITKVHHDLSGLYASGGGDGPEAVTAALAEALQMDWRPTASKMIVLIADAPPHGIGEYGDGEWRRGRVEAAADASAGFDDGSPDGHDPLQLAREMAKHGITLVSCFLHLTGPSLPGQNQDGGKRAAISHGQVMALSSAVARYRLLNVLRWLLYDYLLDVGRIYAQSWATNDVNLIIWRPGTLHPARR